MLKETRGVGRAARRAHGRRRRLVLEALEERIAPTIVVAGAQLAWTDSNGDGITVEYSGPAGSFVDVLNAAGGDIGAGDNIGSIEITGSDAGSVLAVWNDGVGAGDTPIGGNGGIFTTALEDLGVLNLNVAADLSTTGPATLGTGEGVTIGGRLGMLLVSGPVDFDLGANHVNTGGDIGALVFLDDVVLDSTSGLADITAGPGGGGDIGATVVMGDILDSTGGAPAATQIINGHGSLVVADDAGNGTTGSLRLRVRGAAASAEVFTLPVIGGGSLLTRVDLSGEGAGLVVRGTGTGGDVGVIESDAASPGNIQVGGTAGTDVFAVLNTTGNLGAVTNGSAGGDLFRVTSAGDILSVTTHADGKIGALYDGGVDLPTGALQGVLNAGGDIGLISTGSLSGAEVSLPGNLTGVKAGGVMDSTILAGGDIGTVQANLIYGSQVRADGMLGKVLIGRAGMMDSSLTGVGGIGTLVSRGLVVGSTISSLDDPNPGVTPLGGGTIGSLRGTELHDVTVEALGGFGTIVVTGAVSDSSFDTWHYDPVLGYDVGASIQRFQAGTMISSSIEVYGNVGQMKIGAAGMVDGSLVSVGGSTGNVLISGGMADSASLAVAGDLQGNLLIQGDMLGGALVDIAGQAGKIQVNGDVIDSHINVGGSADAVGVKGKLGDSDATIEVGTNAGRIRIGVLNNGSVSVGTNVEALTVAGGSKSGSINIGGDAAAVSIGGGFDESVLDIGGEAARISIGGLLTGASQVSIGGDAGKIMFKGGQTDYSDVNIAGDVESFQVASLTDHSNVTVNHNAGNVKILRMETAGSHFTVGGNLGSFVAGGLANSSDLVVHGNAGKVVITGGQTHHSDVRVTGNLQSLRTLSLSDNSDIVITGNADSILVQDDLTYNSDVRVSGDLESLSTGNLSNNADIVVARNAGAITINGDLADDGDVHVTRNLGSLVIRGAFADDADIYVGSDAGTIFLHSWTGADDIRIYANLGSLVVQQPLDADSCLLYVAGDITTASFAGIAQLDVTVDGSVGAFTSKAAVADLDMSVGRNLGSFAVKGSATDVVLSVGVDAGTVFVGSDTQGFDVQVGGDFSAFLVKGALADSHVEALAGMGIFTVTGLVSNSRISTQDFDAGAPVGGGIDAFKAGEMVDVNVLTHGDIDSLVVRGAIRDSLVDTRAIDGDSVLVGGGDIGNFQARGLYGGEILTYGSLTKASIGRGGIDFNSHIETFDQGTGHIGSLKTTGLIFGEISVAGSVGNIDSAGDDAVPGVAPVDFLFVDSHGVLTGGTLEVGGDVLGRIS